MTKFSLSLKITMFQSMYVKHYITFCKKSYPKKLFKNILIAAITTAHYLMRRNINFHHYKFFLSKKSSKLCNLTIITMKTANDFVIILHKTQN